MTTISGHRVVLAALLSLCVLCMLSSLLPPPHARAEPVSTGSSGNTAADGASSPSSQPVFFSETHFWVAGPFLDFWEQHGGLTTFGYPLSRVFYQDGFLRQYFERAIFERHDELAGTPYQVQVTRLGALLTAERHGEPAFQPVDAAPDQSCDVFQETGHRLCNGFRAYWQAHGGLASFGYPLSEEMVEGGVIVQYFERARFEYHPEFRDTPYDILLGRLGQDALEREPVPPLAVEPESASAQPTAPLGPQPVVDHPVGCGFNMFWWGDNPDGNTNERYLDLAKATGCRWIRVQAQWKQIEPEPGIFALNPLDHFVAAARERDLHLLISVNSPPIWARAGAVERPGMIADARAFGTFMGRLAEHFKGRVDAWQIWNEPNIVYETGGGPIDPGDYLALLRAAGPAIKASDPDALVVLAGLAATSLRDPNLAEDDSWYLETLLGLNHGEAGRYIDVIGIHSYGAGNPPDSYWPNNPAQTPAWNSAPEFYFRHAEALHTIIEGAGLGRLPIWITEFGWGTKNDWPAWGFGNWISDQEQADYLARAYEIARTEWPWVQQMFVWNLNYAAVNGPGHPYSAFSILDGQGKPRPAYNAIKEMPK